MNAIFVIEGMVMGACDGGYLLVNVLITLLEVVNFKLMSLMARSNGETAFQHFELKFELIFIVCRCQHFVNINDGVNHLFDKTQNLWMQLLCDMG
jgi:hypothetical protein